MENRKWLQRKYPESFKELNEHFNERELANFKKSNLKIGRLTKDITCVQKYKKGSIIHFKRSNPVGNADHPLNYCVIKCQEGFTESGYHSFDIADNCFIELSK